MTSASSLYVGAVVHHRLRPRAHRFRYKAFWLLLDLDEINLLPLRWFSYNRFNLFSLYDSDHGDGSAAPLHMQARAKLIEAGIDIAGGSIRLLCMPRTLGYCFNPLSVYFCYRPDGTTAALIYQVHNTFRERHSYVIPIEGERGVIHHHCCKALYVSPFLGMNMDYDFRLSGPSEGLAISIRASSSDGPVLNAVLAGQRRPLDDQNLLRVFFAIPAVTLKVIVAIHWEALRLWLKGIRLHRRQRPIRNNSRMAMNTRLSD
jgi:DUF1365 family protein